MKQYKIASIPGDGIGQEVTPAAWDVLVRAGELHGFSFDIVDLDWGCQRYLDTGEMMPIDGISILSKCDAVFLGAVGDPRVPDHVSLWGLLIPIRRSFDQYLNIRPARSLPGVASPLANPASVDLLIVRENSEGEYSKIGGRQSLSGSEEIALQVAVFSRSGISRVVDYSFQAARGRRGRVTAATKSNGIVHSMPFWDEIFNEVAARYPDVAAELVHVDALAARMVGKPQSLDVVVASNLFGDILSDLAAAVVGGLGLAPSGNVNPSRVGPSMFESVHGSAPDIAGQGVANPIAQVMTGSMMLAHLGESDAATAIEAAVESVLNAGVDRTPDLGGQASTAEVTAAILQQLS